MRGNYKITWTFALVIIALSANIAVAEFQWTNNITVEEYGMVWSYNESFTDIDSILYRIGIDENIGNNDSFISAWEVLLADKEVRKNLKSAIDSEPDVRIDNSSKGIDVIEVDAVLSPEMIGKTMMVDTIVNRYNVTYSFKNSIMDATSIWFMGEPGSPVTIIIPQGIDVINVSGMNNVTKKITDHTELTGKIAEKQKGRGEITINFMKNVSSNVIQPINETNLSSNITEKKSTKTFIERLYESLLGIKNNSFG